MTCSPAFDVPDGRVLCFVVHENHCNVDDGGVEAFLAEVASRNPEDRRQACFSVGLLDPPSRATPPPATDVIDGVGTDATSPSVLPHATSRRRSVIDAAITDLVPRQVAASLAAAEGRDAPMPVIGALMVPYRPWMTGTRALEPTVDFHLTVTVEERAGGGGGGGAAGDSVRWQLIAPIDASEASSGSFRRTFDFPGAAATYLEGGDRSATRLMRWSVTVFSASSPTVEQPSAATLEWMRQTVVGGFRSGTNYVVTHVLPVEITAYRNVAVDLIEQSDEQWEAKLAAAVSARPAPNGADHETVPSPSSVDAGATPSLSSLLLSTMGARQLRQRLIAMQHGTAKVVPKATSGGVRTTSCGSRRTDSARVTGGVGKAPIRPASPDERWTADPVNDMDQRHAGPSSTTKASPPAAMLRRRHRVRAVIDLLTATTTTTAYAQEPRTISRQASLARSEPSRGISPAKTPLGRGGGGPRKGSSLSPPTSSPSIRIRSGSPLFRQPLEASFCEQVRREAKRAEADRGPGGDSLRGRRDASAGRVATATTVSGRSTPVVAFSRDSTPVPHPAMHRDGWVRTPTLVPHTVR